MNIWTEVTGYLKDKYRGGTKTVAVHEVKSDNKAETSLSAFAPGIEINPANGENLIITKIKGSSSFVVTVGGTNQDIEPDTARGERKFYSVSEDGSELKAYVKLKNDGILELNGLDDFAVAFTDLETAENTYATNSDTERTNIITKINAELAKIATAINAIVPGSYTPTPITTSPVSIDISASKVETVKLP